MAHHRALFHGEFEEEKNEAQFHKSPLRNRFIGRMCCCCNTEVVALDNIVCFGKCRHVYHERCLEDQDSFPNSPRCWVCCGRLVRNTETGIYEFKLIWSENWQNLYGELLVWMRDYLGPRVGSVQLQISESFRAFQCGMVGHATFRAFLINPFTDEMRALTELLRYRMYDSLEPAVYDSLGQAVDLLYERTIVAPNRKVTDVSDIFEAVNEALFELNHSRVLMEVFQKRLTDVAGQLPPAA